MSRNQGWVEFFKTQQNRPVFHNKRTGEWAVERQPNHLDKPTTNDYVEIVRYEEVRKPRQSVYVLLAYFYPRFELWLTKESPHGERLFSTGFSVYWHLTRDQGHMFSSDALIEDILKYSSVKIRRNLPEGSCKWKKEIDKIVVAIQNALQIHGEDSCEMNEIVRDAIQTYEKKILIPPKNRTPMSNDEQDYERCLSTRVIVSLVHQAGISITYKAEEDSVQWRKEIGAIVEVIQSTWGLGYKDSEIVHGMFLDAMYAYRSVRRLLETPTT